MKIGLYSITYLGIWYRGRALSMAEVVDRAASFGYDGVEIDGKRPHGNPMDWDERARQGFKDLCASRGLDVVGVAANNDFTSPIPEYRECQLLMVREQIRLCRDLGGRVVRLFMAWPGVTLDANGLASYDQAKMLWSDTSRYSTRLEQWAAVRSCLREAARYAEDAGVQVALQNHRPLLRNYRDMLEMIDEVDSPALRACLDVPILERQDDTYVWQAAQETGARQALSHFNGEFEPGPDGALQEQPFDTERPVINNREFIRAMKAVGYDGYVCYEFCHPALDRSHEPAGLDYVDRQTQLAARYMREQMIAADAYTGGAVALAQ
jgi:sugar phosphate isomerase/epimerase